MNGAVFPAPNALPLQLPWESTVEDERRFRRMVQIALAVFFVASVAVPYLPLEDTVSEARVEEPTPLARIILEPQVLPESAPPEPVAPAAPKLESRPEPKPKSVPPQIKPEPVPVSKPEPAPRPIDKLKQAKDAAASAGLMAFKDDLQAMRDTVDINALNQTQTRRGQATAESVQRSIVTSEALAQSGGIVTADLSTDTGGIALSGRETTAVTSQLAGAGKGAGSSNTDTKAQAHTSGGRSDEAVRRVMDKNKGAIFAIYNRALRKNPLLEGKLVFEMVIEPDGSVAELTLLSSELADDALTRKILSRIKLIAFGSAQAVSTRVNYSFDFLPHT